MKTGEIFNFTHPRDVIVFLFHEKKTRNPLFSIRAWSRKLGFQNPSYLSEVLSGKRNVSVNFGLRVSEALDLSDEERTYFEALVYLVNAKSEEETRFFQSVVKRLRPEESQKAIDPDNYAIIRDWYYGVIDEMTCLKDFRPDPHYIAKRLGGGVTPQSVEVAIKDLLRLGSIERASRGKVVRPKKVYFKTDELSDRPEDPSLRNYQKKFIERSLIAIEEQTKGESFFRMTNIPISAKDIPRFKEHIEDFIQKMGKLECSREADEVYQLSTQFFRLTMRP